MKSLTTAQLARTDIGSSLYFASGPTLSAAHDGGSIIISLRTYVIACSDDPINISNAPANTCSPSDTESKAVKERPNTTNTTPIH